MRIVVINLASQTARMAFQHAQLHALGLSFERLEAVNASDPRVGHNEAYWQSWQRPLSPNERACMLSHLDVWQEVAQSQGPCLILEDDAVLSTDLPRVLQALSAQTNTAWEHLSLETRFGKKCLAKQAQPLTPGSHVRRLYLDKGGAAAYVLWPSGARKLVAHAQAHCGLADALLCWCPGLQSFQVEPAKALQIDVCEAHGVMPPIHTHSSISGPRRRKKTLRQAMRRIGGGLAIALRRVQHWRTATAQAMRLDTTEFAITPSKHTTVATGHHGQLFAKVPKRD